MTRSMYQKRPHIHLSVGSIRGRCDITCKTSTDSVFPVMDVFYFYILNQHGFYLSLLIIATFIECLLCRGVLINRLLGENKALLCRICWFPWRKYSCHGQFQATDMTSLNKWSAPSHLPYYGWCYTYISNNFHNTPTRKILLFPRCQWGSRLEKCFAPNRKASKRWLKD